MKILVTGGCGYKGGVLIPKLLSLGFDVTVIDILWFGNHLKEHKRLNIIKRDILDINSLDLSNYSIVIHLASVANDPCGDLNSKLTWEVNVLATQLVIEKSIQDGVKQFIYASSGSVYGVSDEPNVTEDLPLTPISDYNKTKMVAERIILSYQNQIRVQIVRPATVCGYSPRMRLDVSVNMLTMQALENKKMTVFGGKQTRPNIHIDDITDLYCYLIENPNITGIYNAGFENMSIMNIASAIQVKTKAKIVLLKSNDPRSYRINSEKILSTGFKPKKNVNIAINELIELYKENILVNKNNCYNIKVMKESNVDL